MPQRVPYMKKTSSAKKPAAKLPPPPQKSARKTAAKPTDFTELKSLQEIKELIEFAVEKEFDEIELARGDFRLRLRKGGSQTVSETPIQIAVPTMSHAVAPPAAAPVAATPVAIPAPHAAAAPPEAVPPPEEALHIITSPIVGTFYRSSSPTIEPFIKPGDLIEANQTLCIIEAMKLMNEIQSDVSGTVVKILVESGQPVEYGQPLFGIKI